VPAGDGSAGSEGTSVDTSGSGETVGEAGGSGGNGDGGGGGGGGGAGSADGVGEKLEATADLAVSRVGLLPAE